MENPILWYNRKVEEAQFYRLGVMAFILMVHVNIVVPATLLVVTMNGSGIWDLMICAGFSFIILISLLSVMPTKVTIPIFLISTTAHIALILSILL